MGSSESILQPRTISPRLKIPNKQCDIRPADTLSLPIATDRPLFHETQSFLALTPHQLDLHRRKFELLSHEAGAIIVQKTREESGSSE